MGTSTYGESANIGGKDFHSLEDSVTSGNRRKQDQERSNQASILSIMF